MIGRSFFLAWLAFTAVAFADYEMAKNPPRVEILGDRKRFTKVAGGDWDDRTQKVQMRMTVRNLDLNKPVENLKCIYWALAESLVDKRAFKVIDRGEFAVNLTNLPDGREVSHEGQEVTLKWDDTGVKFGERYKGFVAVVLNDAGEVVAVKANQPTWEREFRKAFNLKNGAWCNLQLEPASDPD